MAKERIVDLMPNRAKSICNHAGCAELASIGHYCNAHSQQSNTTVPDHGRDKEVHRLYDRKWKARREKFLASNPWCEDCLSRGIYTPATDVHHEHRHRGDRMVFNTSPLKAQCHSCHAKKTSEEIKKDRRPIPPINVSNGRLSSAVGIARKKMSPIKALKHGKSE